MPTKPNRFLRWITVAIITCAMAFPCAAQNKTVAPPQPQFLQELSNNPALQAEIQKLASRLQTELRWPGPRSESRLLPVLPSSTMVYVALPNYGDAIHQASSIFQQELQGNATLRDWWQRGGMEKVGPVLQSSADKIYEMSQYLGDEIVIGGGTDGREPKITIVAEVRKPGLKEALEHLQSASNDKATPSMMVLSAKDLAAAPPTSARKFVILVRPDYVVGALDLATLRALSTSLDKHAGDFASAAFGQRVKRAYEGGVTTVGAIDVHSILAELPITKSGDQATFQRTGFADTKYWVWRRKNVGGRTISEAELTFLGPRHGIARTNGQFRLRVSKANLCGKRPADESRVDVR